MSRSYARTTAAPTRRERGKTQKREQIERLTQWWEEADEFESPEGDGFACAGSACDLLRGWRYM